ncbi:response regulator transcription factor [Solwaraspora sp. WMMB335]|uniref:response regulator transcription factor n=1 Tax=Solwaraspora sp. WMMB335 TaxID=3404118 RepID=UPI003B9229D8
MRIALADDGALFRNGLQMLLEAAGHEVVEAFDNGDDLVEAVHAEPVDVAILDIRMPPEPEGGLTTAGRLRASHPTLGILLLSHHAETRYLSRMLEIGPSRIGYRLKDQITSVAALHDTLTRIVAGEIVIDTRLTSKLVEYSQTRQDELRHELSGQELRVLRLMATGLSNAGIAEEMGVTRKAVEKHVSAVFTKLSLPDTSADNRRVLAVLRYLGS